MKDHFVKGADCPTSHDLDAYQQGICDAAEVRSIKAHVRVCEFCEAEMAFYARFSDGAAGSDELDLPPMPEPLRELAEAILTGPDDSVLDLEFLALEN